MDKRLLEKDIEAHLRDEVRARGWGIRKYINDPIRGGTAGTPDQIVTLPGKIVAWVECKQPRSVGPYRKRRARYYETGDTTGCSKTEIRQFREQQLLEDQDQSVTIVGTYEEVDDLILKLEVMYG